MTETKPAIAIAVAWDPEPWAKRFRAIAPDREIVVIKRPDDPLPARYHLFAWKPSATLLQRQPRPLMICSAGAGVDHIFKGNPPEGIPITRIVDPDLTGRMVEYIVLHSLIHLRRMNEAAANQRKALWQSDDFPAAREVTVGILGVGEMGQASARGLKAIGFDVLGWGRSKRDGLPFKAFAGASELDAFLARTDILVCLLPSTPETRGLINAGLLGKLRRNGPFGAPVLINAGRGDAVNDMELLQALQDGTLRAASLDVFSTEPLPADNPLWHMENVIITPHNAADSHPEAVVAAVMAEIERFEAGLAPIHGVDRTRGY